MSASCSTDVRRAQHRTEVKRVSESKAMVGWLVVLFVQSAHTQGTGDPPPQQSWLSGLQATYAQHREALEEADLRNRKLFGNPRILVDIGERGQFATDEDYEMTAGAASRWLELQFPILEEAFSAGQVETCANASTGMIYLRGRAPEVDFAAAVPISDVTGGGARGRPWAITLVRRGAAAEAEADLRRVLEGNGSEQARLWTRYLSRFGDVVVRRAHRQLPDSLPAQLKCAHVHAEGAFNTLGLVGRLRIVAGPAVLHLELSDIQPPGLRLQKAFMPILRSGAVREPDWSGPGNVHVSPPSPETNKAGG